MIRCVSTHAEAIIEFSSYTMTGSEKLLMLSLACVILMSQSANGARILGVFPLPSISHQVVYRGLMKELARRGHDLVVITPDPVNDREIANYTEIDVSRAYDDFRNKNDFTAARLTKATPYQVFTHAFASGDDMCETVMGHEQVQAMIHPDNTDETFDLVFLELLLTPCTLAFPHRFSAPVIGLTSMPLMAAWHDSFGNPSNPSYIPDMALPFTDKHRTFLQRLTTTIYSLRMGHYFYSTLLPRQDAIVKKYFGPSTPYIGDLHNKFSMVFETYVEGFHNPRPNVPAVVYVNGLHINPPKTLPQDMKQFLDSSPKGAIYFSLGSNVRSDRLPQETVNMFLEAFTELPDYHVLWKWESDNLPGRPDNVMVAKWMPQHDILRHPKVKIFITQGGEQSTEEALHSHVPMIGIPFFCDQDYNTRLAEERGISIRLDINNLTKNTFLEALRKVIQDDSYRVNIQRLSALINDRQIPPMERAVWWTEYVLRHKGAQHLRTAAVDMSWYTYLLLDIVVFILVIMLLTIALIWTTMRFIYNKLLTFKKLKQI